MTDRKPRRPREVVAAERDRDDLSRWYRTNWFQTFDREWVLFIGSGGWQDPRTFKFGSRHAEYINGNQWRCFEDQPICDICDGRRGAGYSVVSNETWYEICLRCHGSLMWSVKRRNEFEAALAAFNKELRYARSRAVLDKKHTGVACVPAVGDGASAGRDA